MSIKHFFTIIKKKLKTDDITVEDLKIILVLVDLFGDEIVYNYNLSKNLTKNNNRKNNNKTRKNRNS